MKETVAKMCTTCKWLLLGEHTDKRQKSMCINPTVISYEAEVLAGIIPGIPCFEERNKYFLGKCGIKGKLWEAKKEWERA